MSQKDILFPVARMIGGSTTKGDSTDSKGQPRVVKTGPNAGQPLTQYGIGMAIQKAGEAAWTHTAWGALIYAAGQEGYPNGETQRPDFSWKVIDGDSQIPNKKGKRPCDQTGYPGHWILWLSTYGTPPKLYDIIGNKVGDAPRPLAPGMEIVPGYYIQVFGNAKDNKPSETPGVYLNPQMIGLVAYGERISQGPDASEVGFGGAALPAGASTVPTGGMAPPPAAAQVAPPPATLPPPAAAAQVAPPPATVAPLNPAILAAPPPPAAQPAPPPPAAPGLIMTGAYTYEQLKAANYSDEQMIAQNFARRG